MKLDAYSDPRDPSRYSANDLLSLQYLNDPEFLKKLAQTTSLASVNPADFDAVLVAGGQAPMFTFANEPALHRLFEAFYRSGKICAALCHGTSLLLHLTKPDGSPFLSGLRITGFTNAEEDAVEAAMQRKVMPFRIEEEARKLGAEFISATPFRSHALRTGNLITGQQQNSGREVATLVIDALENPNLLNVAFLGVGNVGAALAEGLSRAGHRVAVGARPDSASALKAATRNPHFSILTPQEAVAQSSVVFLATPFNAVEETLKPLAQSLKGKIVVDCTNPVGAGLTHGLESKISGSEKVQALIPEAAVVKAFTVYGFENFEDSHYPGYGTLLPAMPITGNDAKAKAVVARLCKTLGFVPVDSGALANSLHLEHQTLLWIKMARVAGKGAGFTWGLLERPV